MRHTCTFIIGTQLYSMAQTIAQQLRRNGAASYAQLWQFESFDKAPEQLLPGSCAHVPAGCVGIKWFQQLFDTTVTINNPGEVPQLLLYLVADDTDADIVDTLQQMSNMAAQCQRNICCHLLILPTQADDIESKEAQKPKKSIIGRLIEKLSGSDEPEQNDDVPADPIEDDADRQSYYVTTDLYQRVAHLCQPIAGLGDGVTQSVSTGSVAFAGNALVQRICRIESSNAQGASLCLTPDSLAHIVAGWLTALTCSYNQIFSPSIDHNIQSTTAIGLSALCFDRDYFNRYLLHGAYIYILQREGLHLTTIDANRAVDRASKLLSGRQQIADSFWEETVKPMLQRTPRPSDNDIIAAISDAATQKVDALHKQLTAFLDEHSTSLPEKRAILAEMLGLDDELLAEYQFQTDPPTLSDLLFEPLDYYIRRDNDNVVPILDFEGKPVVDANGNKVYTGGRITGSNETGGNNKPEIGDIKQLRIEIKKRTAHLRDIDRQLEQLSNVRSATATGLGALSSHGFTYGGHLYLLQDDSEQPPLEETYTTQTKPAESVDLRNRFSDVRDQGDRPACTSYALSSIVESMINSEGQQQYLSPSYIHRNATLLEYYDNDDDALSPSFDQGISFYHALLTMGEKGVCPEELYSADQPLSDPPTPEADEAAANCRVLKAMNIEVSHKAITAALTDGLPVAISLRIFDSFTPNGAGFVFMPSAEEQQGPERQWHAMVVVGYVSDPEVYIVRNSWGTSFGHEGYCYIPYYYIDNPALCRQACIIAQVTNPAAQRKPMPNVVKFDQADDEIRYSLLRIARDKASGELQKAMHRQSQHVALHNQQLIDLGNPIKRDGIIKDCNTKLQNQLNDKKHEYDDFMNNEYMRRRNAQKRLHYWTIAIVSLFVLLILLPTILILYANQRQFTLFTKILSAVSILGIVFVVFLIPYLANQRKKFKAELDERGQQLKIQLESIRRQRQELPLRSYLKAAFFDKTVAMYHSITALYNKMVSYTDNLRQWLADEQECQQHLHPGLSFPYISIMDEASLRRYFEDNRELLTQNVWLYKLIDSYAISATGIEQFRTELHDAIMREIDQRAANFNMASYLTGGKTYDYMPPADNLQALIQQLEAHSILFAKPAAGALYDPNRYLLCLTNGDDQLVQLVNQKLLTRFSTRPTMAPLSTPDQLLYLQWAELEG